MDQRAGNEDVGCVVVRTGAGDLRAGQTSQLGRVHGFSALRRRVMQPAVLGTAALSSAKSCSMPCTVLTGSCTVARPAVADCYAFVVALRRLFALDCSPSSSNDPDPDSLSTTRGFESSECASAFTARSHAPS